MCICINCQWVDRCKTYHAVEKHHGVKHLSNSPDFQGNNPKIHIIVRETANVGIQTEWDVRACASFIEDSGRWTRLRPGQKQPT